MVKRGIGVTSAVTAIGIGATIGGTVYHADRPLATIGLAADEALAPGQRHEHDERVPSRQPGREAVYRVTSSSTAPAELWVTIPGYRASVIYYRVPETEHYGRIFINVTSAQLVTARSVTSSLGAPPGIGQGNW